MALIGLIAVRFSTHQPNIMTQLFNCIFIKNIKKIICLIECDYLAKIDFR